MGTESGLRRGMERSKEPGLLAKKPRTADPRGALLEGNRIRDPPPADQHQMGELAGQYKAALAELTFNSKPIITNLTIIAGENMPASRAISAVICNHILQVPSDQKLPSLYLLDSIVKNIGRDYIKHFASRLPEVFCKAYRQVDSSIHQGMRHLFGTWKGVFPPPPLLAIEKELGFEPVVNGSSTGVAGSRPESQAQRPPHSIHVNPKYLEARQQLQQPGRVKAVIVEKGPSVVEGMEKTDRVTAVGSPRLWPDPLVKAAPRSQRELPNESSLESISGRASVERVSASDYSRHPNLGIQRSGVRFPDKPGPGVRKLTNHETVLAERMNSDGENLKALRTSQTLAHALVGDEMPSKMNSLVGSRNWKNSEEEEYSWDLGNSRSFESEVSNNSWSYVDSENPARLHGARRITPDVDSLQGSRSKVDNVSRVGKLPVKERLFKSKEEIELIAASSLQRNSQRTSREHSADSLPSGASFDSQAKGMWSLHEIRPGPFGSVTGSSRNISIQEDIYPNIPSNSQQPQDLDPFSFPKRVGGRQLGPMKADLTVDTVSSSARMPSNPPPSFPKPSNSAELKVLEVEKMIQIPGPPISQLLTQVPKLESGSFQQLQRHSPSIKTEEPLVSSSLVDSGAVSVDMAKASKLLDVIAKSGLLPITSSGSQMQLISSLPPLSGSHPVPSSLSGSGGELPPLPPGPHPLSSMLSANKGGPNLPLSNLLSSLVANGLISSGKELASSSIPEPIADESSSRPLPSTSFSVSLPSTSEPARVSSGPSSAPQDSSVSLKQRRPASDRGALIGIDFRPDVLREYHLEVLNRLYGLSLQDIDAVKDEPRFRSRDEIQTHFGFNWFFESKLNSEGDSDKEPFRKWFPSLEQYISIDDDSLSGTALENISGGILAKPDDLYEPMVPADEGQCICAMCGEPFEDAYCVERDAWMYRGAVYCCLKQLPKEEVGAKAMQQHGLIVHARCRSREEKLDAINPVDACDGFDRIAIKTEMEES